MLKKSFLRFLPIFSFSICTAIPLTLLGSTLQAWLATQNVGIELIGKMALVQLPYSVKFLWAPLLDKFELFKLGRRRGWMLFTQVALFLLICIFAFSKPEVSLFHVAFLATLITFMGASHDIVLDAYKLESFEKSDYAVTASVYNLGYRIGLVLASAGGLILADHIGWQNVYLVMGMSMLVAILMTISIQEPYRPLTNPPSFFEAFREPLQDFFRKKNVFQYLALILLYKFDIIFAMALMTPFLLSLNFSNTEIAGALKVGNIVMATLGAVVGGFCIKRYKLYPCLWVFQILQITSIAGFYILSLVGKNYLIMNVSLMLEGFITGLGNSAYAVFLMSLCSNPLYSATQFALVTSLMSVTRVLTGWPAGYFTKAYGWNTYFLIAMFCGIPSLIVLYFSRSWKERPDSSDAS